MVVGVGGGADGSPVCIPVRGSGGFPTYIDKIGEDDGSSVSVPKLCDGIGEREESSVSGSTLCDGIGEGSASSVSVPEMCSRIGEGGDGSPKRVVDIGRSRLRVDHLGQLYVLDSEDEGIGMEVGLFVPDSEEEDGGDRGCGRRQLRRRARLPGGVVGAYNRGRAGVPSTDTKIAEKMTMLANPATEVATVANPAREVAMVVDPPHAVATVVDPAAKVVTVEADVHVPVGAAAAAAELHPEVV